MAEIVVNIYTRLPCQIESENHVYILYRNQKHVIDNLNQKADYSRKTGAVQNPSNLLEGINKRRQQFSAANPVNDVRDQSIENKSHKIDVKMACVKCD